jgi:hypothetical protein
MNQNRSNTAWKMPLSLPSTTTLCWLENVRVTDDAAGEMIAEMQATFSKNPAKFPPIFLDKYRLPSLLCEGEGEDGRVPEANLPTVSRVWERYTGWLRRHPYCIAEREALKTKHDSVDALVRAWHGCDDGEREQFTAAINFNSRVRAERARKIERAANERLLTRFAHLDGVLAMSAGPEKDRALELLDDVAF